MKVYSHIFVLWMVVLVITLSSGTGFGETLIAFGDSLTEGCGPVEQVIYDEDCGWVGRTDAYPYFLETYYANDGRDIPVRNFGWGGETTASGLNRLDAILDNPCIQEAKYILIHEGTNDLFHHESEMTTRFNLSQMIDKVRAKGFEPLLATVTPDLDHPWKNIVLLNDYIRSLAQEKDVVLVDLYNELVGSWNAYVNPPGCYGDQLHPNTLGLQYMAAVWYESLADLLVVKNTSMPWLILLLGTP